MGMRMIDIMSLYIHSLHVRVHSAQLRMLVPVLALAKTAIRISTDSERILQPRMAIARCMR